MARGFPSDQHALAVAQHTSRWLDQSVSTIANSYFRVPLYQQ